MNYYLIRLFDMHGQEHHHVIPAVSYEVADTVALKLQYATVGTGYTVESLDVTA